MKPNNNGVVHDYEPRGGIKTIPLGNTTECLYALKNYGDDEEIRDAATRKLWMMCKEEREENRLMVQRKMPRFELTAEQKEEEELFYSLFDDGGENTADYDEQDGMLSRIGHLPADELEDFVMWLYDELLEFQVSLMSCCCKQDEKTRALYYEIGRARKAIEHKIGFF